MIFVQPFSLRYIQALDAADAGFARYIQKTVVRTPNELREKSAKNRTSNGKLFNLLSFLYPNLTDQQGRFLVLARQLLAWGARLARV